MDYRDVTVRLLGDVAGYTQKLGLAGDITADFVRTISGLEAKLDSLRISAGKSALALGAGLQASLTGATFAAARWESQFANVRKTVDATNTELASLEKNLRAMSTQMPVSAGELANLAAIAGQLGVATESIDEFAAVGAKLGVATELSSEQAIVSLSRLIKVMNAAEGDIEGLGATLVQLGNISNASEGPILDFAQNIAGTAGSFGMTAAAVMGIATAFAEAGIESEAGGTAVQRVLIDMKTAATTGGPQLQVFARTLGMTSERFRDLVKNDPTEAFLRFNEALKVAGGDSIRILKDLNLDDARLIRAFTNVANASGSMRERVEQANGAFEDQSALNQEAETRFNTLMSALTQFKNVTAEILRSWGDPFVEAVTKVVKAATWMMNLFNKIPQPIKDAIAIFSGLSAGFLVAVGSALLLAKTVGTVLTVMKLLRTTIPLTIIKGLAAGFTEVTIAGKQMGYMSRGLNSQSLALQRLFNFSREAAVGFKGMTRGIAEFLGMASTNRIKGVGLSLAAMVAKPLGAISGHKQTAKIVADAAEMQKRINEEIGKQTGDIPMGGLEKFWRATKRGYYSMTASIGDALRKIPSMSKTLSQQVSGTEKEASKIRRIFNDLSGSFSKMMERVRSGGGDTGAINFGAIFGTKSQKDADKATKQVTGSLLEQTEAIKAVGESTEDLTRKRRDDNDATDRMNDNADETAKGFGLIEVAIGAAVVGWQLYSSWQDRIADRMGTAQTQAKQVAAALGQQYDATMKLASIKVPDSEKNPEYKSAEFGSKFSEVLATIAARKDNGVDAQLDVVRNLIINTALNGQVTPEFLTTMEGILKRIFGEKKGEEYFLRVKVGLVDSKGRATTALDVKDQLAALDSFVPEVSNRDREGIVASGFKEAFNTSFGAQGEGKSAMKTVAQQFVQAMGSTEAGGPAGAQALMKSFMDGIDSEVKDGATRMRLKRQFLGMIEDASEVDGKEKINFDFLTSGYADAINDLKKNDPGLGFLETSASMDALVRASKSAQVQRKVDIAQVKEQTGIYKILSDVQYDMVANDNAAASSRFSRAVAISEQTQGLRETVKQLKEYRKNLPQGEQDGEEFRRVTSEIEKLDTRLRNLDLKKLDEELGSMDGIAAIQRLNMEILRLQNNVNGFDAEKMEALYTKREEAQARAEGELRSMVMQEESLLKQREQMRKDHNERLAELAQDRDESLAREKRNYDKRLKEIDKAEKEALERQAENYQDFADPFSRITNKRQEGAGAVTVNVRDQNKMFAEFQKNLDRLRSLGMSDEVIEAMGLNDPDKMQQVGRFVTDALANPKVIAELNAAWKDRIRLSEAFAQNDKNETTKEIKKSFKDMRDSAKESFDEASKAINESYRKTVNEAEKNFKKASDEIGKQLASIGKNTSDTLQKVIDKAMKSNNEHIRDFVARFKTAAAEVMTAANEIQKALFAGPWWVFLGFTSAEAARKYGMTQKDAENGGWTTAMAPTNPLGATGNRADTNTRQLENTGTGTATIPTGQFNPVPPALQPGTTVKQPAPLVVPAPVVAPTPTPFPRNVPVGALRTFSSPETSTSTTINNTTAFSGITVQASDPNEMARKLKQKARLSRLTSPHTGLVPL